jgi:hypothetical protein
MASGAPHNISGAFLAPEEVKPMFIRKPLVLNSSVLSQSSPYPCDVNSISVRIFSNVPLYKNCTPQFTIIGLRNTQTGSQSNNVSMVLQRITPENTLINASTWEQSSGTLQFDVTSDLVSDEYSNVNNNGTTSFSFNFAVRNWQKSNDGPSITIKGSFRNPLVLGLELWDNLVIRGENKSEFPLYLLQPSINALNLTQSSPYPCDNNTILVEFTTNTPIFAACRPTFILTGLTGSIRMSNSTLLSLSGATTGIAANSTAETVGAVFWEQSSGEMRFGLNADIGTTPSAGLGLATVKVSFTFTLANQEKYQDAPRVEFAVKYNTGAIGGSWSFGSHEQVWSVARSGVNKDHLWITKHGRDIYLQKDSAVERQPLFIRRGTFLQRRIFQDYPWPSSANTLTVYLKFNMDLLLSCRPIIHISKLKGACIQGSRVDLVDKDAPRFSDVNYSASSATWNEVNETLMVRPADSADPFAPPSLLSDTEYTFSFDIVNPVHGQDGPQVTVELFLISNRTDSQLMTQNISGQPPGGYFKMGDAKALKVYPPEFFVKTVRQSNPFPGMYNNITISLAANVDLSFPASITIAGLKILTLPDSEVPAQSVNVNHSLAPLGRIALFQSNLLSCPASAGYQCLSGTSYLKAISDDLAPGYGYFNDKHGRVVLNLGDTIIAGNYFSFSFQIRCIFVINMYIYMYMYLYVCIQIYRYRYHVLRCVWVAYVCARMCDATTQV